MAALNSQPAHAITVSAVACSQAIEYVKVAVAEDEAGNYEKALQNYKAALEYFQAHLKYEKNPRSAEAIKAKLIEYLERAEYLKGVISGQQAAPAAAAANGAATAQRKGGGGDDSNDKERDKLKGQLGSAIMSGEGRQVRAACSKAGVETQEGALFVNLVRLQLAWRQLRCG